MDTSNLNNNNSLPMTGSPELDAVKAEYAILVPPVAAHDFKTLRDTLQTMVDDENRLHFGQRAAQLRAMIDSAENAQNAYNHQREHFLDTLGSNELQRRNALAKLDAELVTLREKQQDVQTTVDGLTATFREKTAQAGLRGCNPDPDDFEDVVRQTAAGLENIRGYHTTKEADPEPVKPVGFHFKKVGLSEIIFGFISGLFLAISIASRFGWLNLISLKHGQFDPMSLVALLLGCATTVMAGQMAMGTVRGILLLDEFAKTSQRIIMGIFAAITVLFVAGEISIEAGGLQLFGQMLEDLRALQFHTHRIEVPIWGYILMAFIASAIYIGLRANTAYHATLPEVEYKGELKDWKNRRINRSGIMDLVCNAAVRLRSSSKLIVDADVALAQICGHQSKLENAIANTKRAEDERSHLDTPVMADLAVVNGLVQMETALQQTVMDAQAGLKNPMSLSITPASQP